MKNIDKLNALIMTKKYIKRQINGKKDIDPNIIIEFNVINREIKELKHILLEEKREKNDNRNTNST